jgi:hypothetical protein
MRKYQSLGELKTGNGTWCNNATFQYYTERLKNDINGNARHKITIILFGTVLSFNVQCQTWECKKHAERFINEYLQED